MSMINRLTLSRSGAIAGVVSVVLMVSGVVLVASLDLPYEGPAAVLASAIEEKRRALGFGVFLFALANVVPTGTGKGVGLLSMRERAELLGGRLSVQSSPGGGCQVSLFIP